ncbi:ROK family transcriptional regulator [Rhizobium sp. TRM95111]|nr:ROK family transcriptional regulator [Rhizobium alarense]
MLSYIWRKGGCFRTEIAENVGLTEASVSRIVAELRSEGILAETRQTAEYQGGPSAILTLSNNHKVGAIEVSNNRVHVGIADLAGEMLFSERFDLKDGASAQSVTQALDQSVSALAERASRTKSHLEYIGVSIPGYDPRTEINPIIALPPASILDRVRASFAEAPVEIANSVVARAIDQRLRLGVVDHRDDYLYVFVGHGVAAAVVNEHWGSGDVIACELGHMVVEAKGPRCRCGHSGCLEAYLSTSAIAPRLKIEEADLLALGDTWPQRVPLGEKISADLMGRLRKLGMAIGNALNLIPARRVFLGGWPANLGAEGHAALTAGIDSSLLGGASRVTLKFVQSELGREPASALSLATFAYLKCGAQPVAEEGRRSRIFATT